MDGTGGEHEEKGNRGEEKPPMRNATTPLRHSQFSDAVGSGIIFNIDAYSVDRFAFYTYRCLLEPIGFFRGGGAFTR